MNWLNNLFKAKKKRISPSKYFDEIKNKKHEVTDKTLNEYYDNCLKLITKYENSGQRKALEKLLHLTSCVEKEREVIHMGIETFVYRDDVFEYIEDVAKNVIKVIELKNYSRDIPDDVLEKYHTVKHLFDEFYVVYTDYTGNTERKIKAEKRDKDPILFGVFKKKIGKTNYLNDRMYVIGDWEDEYCDLTLEKMVTEYKESKNKNIEQNIKTPNEVESLIGRIVVD
ncbi:hypothetical protein QOK74_08165 [Staphylococcus saprophyticus]|uniref:hypothetical protein n=1 Tax=Staphylococcus saprophyticus TaxID=29385 RepID=UPI0024C39F4C|nr:hypothetical protein [Staphylococcus saprophyticus]MDK1672845.1 hypothetical protein [Staphylococcus saprophyticus]